MRQLYILKATLKVHKTIKTRQDYKDLTGKRIFRIPMQMAKSELYKRSTLYAQNQVYNNVVREIDIKDRSLYTCKNMLQTHLCKLNYNETEELVR